MKTAMQGEEIDNAVYHTSPGVSHSALQVFRRDPREYKYVYIDGNYDRERKDYFDFGSAVHEMALLRSDANICVIPDEVLSSSGSKAGKAWKEFEAENSGKLLLKQRDFDSVVRCVESIYKHPLAGKFLACDGVPEQMYSYVDANLELKLKCKPDKPAITPHGTVIVDLKTTDNPSAKSFVNSIVSYNYDCQQYFYERVLRALGHDIIKFVFIVVGKNPPHPVNVFSINEEDMGKATEIVENALGEMAERYRANYWMPYNADKITKLSLPRNSQYRTEYQ
jgi:hypothetical protein